MTALMIANKIMGDPDYKPTAEDLQVLAQDYLLKDYLYDDALASLQEI